MSFYITLLSNEPGKMRKFIPIKHTVGNHMIFDTYIRTEQERTFVIISFKYLMILHTVKRR